jgi:hypothetical protein
MRYFFHILRNDSIFKDEAGQIFSGVEGAKAHASVIARELAEDTGWEGFSVLIVDEIGTEVARLPIVP